MNVEMLERQPLRNIVLLKHLEAFPNHTTLHQTSSALGHAALVLLEVAASAYDTRTYPTAKLAALISSDHPTLTHQLLGFVPRGVDVVFKLSSDADRDAVAAHFTLERTTSVLSFTAQNSFARDVDVCVTLKPNDAVFDVFESQHHARDWLEPLLTTQRAFVCVLKQEVPVAVCFAFENHGRVWEVGGVFTPPEFRGQGFAARVVCTALAELQSHQRIPRYQVHEDNTPSIRLAEHVGLELFLTITHFLHRATV